MTDRNATASDDSIKAKAPVCSYNLKKMQIDKVDSNAIDIGGSTAKCPCVHMREKYLALSIYLSKYIRHKVHLFE